MLLTDWRKPIVAACSALLLASSVGCQIDVGGQTLPSAWWLTDDVQYFAPGPEFKLAREAAAMGAMPAGPAYGVPPGARPPGAIPPGAIPGPEAAAPIGAP